MNEIIENVVIDNVFDTNEFDESLNFEEAFLRINVNSYVDYDVGDGRLINSKRCPSNKCTEFGPHFLPSDRVYSASTGRYYDCINEDFPNVIDCKTVNCIYCITCANCLMQNVGETVDNINRRFTTHRACMRGAEYTTGCKKLGEHFSTGPCKGSSYFVQILEKLSGSGRIGKEKDPEVTKERRRREQEWMLKLRTVYPYGLNDSLNSDMDPCGIVGIHFPSLPRNFSHPLVRRSSQKLKAFDHESFFRSLFELFQTNLRSVSKFLRVSLFGMRKSYLKTIAEHIHNILCISDDETLQFSTWLRMALDIIETKIYNPPPEKTKKELPKYRIKIPFVNKAMDFINLAKLLRSNELASNMPPVMQPEDIPMVVYSLSETTRSKILNYKKFVTKELDLDAFSKDSNSISCNCSNYSNDFIDPNRGHVLTGNLQIIKNNKLRKLISKGPKFREPCKIDWNIAKDIIREGVEDYLKTLKAVKKVDISFFENWKQTLFKMIDEKIKSLSDRIIIRDIKSVFDDPAAKAELKRLQSHFVIVPIDKASSNVSFICKQHYATVIKNELRFSLPITPDDKITYKKINKTSSSIIKSHFKDLKKYNLKTDEKMEKLPSMYWIPKLHKNPIGERFIIASPECSIKPLLKDVTCILKLLQNNVTNYHDKRRVWTNVSNFWVIQNNRPVTERIEKINNAQKAKTVQTFDFSTLYTKIPHHLLKGALEEIVDFCFEGGNSDGIYIENGKAFWRKPKRGEYRTYTKVDIKKVLKFVMNNAYFQVNNQVFQQVIGIPMGSDPAPFIANLFLYFYESKFLDKLKKEDLHRARRLRHVFRFIDDLIALNDNNEFAASYKEIYPEEMELKPENVDHSSSSYLDLQIDVDDKQFDFKLFDKRDAFPFSVVRMPHLQSNMPSKMFYSTISAEILRICRATFKYSNFLLSCEKLLIRMIKQGAKPLGIKNVVCKMIRRHSSDFEKFLKSAESITLDLFNSTISCEILRISEQNSDYSKFVLLSKKVLRQVANQGSTLISIKRSLERISSSTTYFEQYHKDSEVIISDLF